MWLCRRSARRLQCILDTYVPPLHCRDSVALDYFPAALPEEADSECLRTRSCIEPQPLPTPSLCLSSINPIAVCRNDIKVPPSASVSRYCTFEMSGNDEN